MEGRQAVRELLIAGRRKVREVVLATVEDDDERSGAGRSRRPGGPEGSLEELAALAHEVGAPVREVNRRRLQGLARTEAPQGVVAHAAPLPEADLADLARRGKGPAPFLVAADGVTDPGNLGAVLRSAECAGATGAVLPRHRAVHVTPTVAKAAAGAIEHVPIALVGGLPAAIRLMQDHGVLVIGLDAAGPRPVFGLPLDADQAVCLVAGSEGRGLSRLVRERCDLVVSIPQVGQLASLNVATATTVACYEIARCRLAL